MFHNRFDEAMEEVSIVHGLDWNDESKVALFARFLDESCASFQAWEDFLERQAAEEIVGDDLEEDDNAE